MILCCGEALIEMLPATTADGAPAFAPEPAGTALGTAVALGRLGAPAGFLGGLSTDGFGDLLVRTLDAARAHHDLAPRRPEPTALAFLDATGRQTLRAEATAGRAFDPTGLPPLPAAVTALFLGGAHLAAAPCGPGFEALASREAPGRVVMLDPNIRPHLIADPEGFRARIERMIALSHILKLSEQDLDWLRGAGDRAGQAEALCTAGPGIVVVTHGARGATAFTATGAEVFVPAPSVTVADRRGAGETFNAGLLAALHRAGELSPDRLAQIAPAALRSAVNLGVHAASVTVSRRGANPPFARELR